MTGRSMMVTPKEYWDRKIRVWETSVYQQAAGGAAWLERLATPFRGPVRLRMDATIAFLSPWVAGRTVLDLGCGSGILAARLLAQGAAAVMGVDIAPSAVQAARERVSPLALPTQRAVFIEQDVTGNGSLPEADLTVGLGFLDYLTEPQIVRLFQRLRSPWYCFSFPEWRWSLRTFLHEIYLRAAGCPVFRKYTRVAFDELLGTAGRLAGRQYALVHGLWFLHNLPPRCAS